MRYTFARATGPLARQAQLDATAPDNFDQHPARNPIAPFRRRTPSDRFDLRDLLLGRGDFDYTSLYEDGCFRGGIIGRI